LSFTSGPQASVERARERAAALLGTQSAHFTLLEQIHSGAVIPASISDRGKRASPTVPKIGRGDALVTQEPGLPLAILVADCVSVFLVDPARRAVGLAHAGWRGTLAGIGRKTVRVMQNLYETNPRDLLAWIGPGIGRCCFEVGTEVVDEFAAVFPDWNDCWSVEPRRIDLKEINVRTLISEGLSAENIEVSDECTVCRPGYFSYRRDRPLKGHNMAALMIAESSG
ncbi:peptidoglycan editing factor PgeF, partial [Thermococci archaeon]